MYIAVEGQDALDQNVRAIVLLDLNEAADLFEELGKIFGPKDGVIAPKDVATSMPPFPKIDVPPLREEPAPGTEKQKSLADFLKELEKNRQPLPHKSFEWIPQSPLNPTFPTTPGYRPNDIWCGGYPTRTDGTFDPRATAAATVDFAQVAKKHRQVL